MGESAWLWMYHWWPATTCFFPRSELDVGVCAGDTSGALDRGTRHLCRSFSASTKGSSSSCPRDRMLFCKEFLKCVGLSPVGREKKFFPEKLK